MRLAKLIAIIAIMSPATSFMSAAELRQANGVARFCLCASSSNPSWRGVPACHPSDESSDLRDERLGIYVADMSGGRHRKTRLRTVCGLPGRMVGRIQ